MTRAAVANRHSYTALDGLEDWRNQMPGADSDPVWQDIWAEACARLPAADAVRRADILWRDASRLTTARALGGFYLLVAGRNELMPELNTLYNKASQEEQAGMEKRLFGLMPQTGNTQLESVVLSMAPGQERKFPWSIYILESARRANVRDPEAAKALMDKIAGGRIFANSALAGAASRGVTNLPDPEDLISGSVQFYPVCVTLALPMSGHLQNVGQRVSAGSDVAQRLLAKAGISVTVNYVDTDNPNWVSRLDALPPQCALVGGPLTPDAYQSAKEQGLTSRRALFTFLYRLDDNDEGQTAWRFFPSREDQIRAMLNFSRQLGVSSFASYAPEDEYGHYMSSLFVNMANQAGWNDVRVAGYPPNDQSMWTKSSGALVGGRLIGKVPAPSTSFQAVFLPDSWNNMEMLVGTIFYHGEDRLLLLGTSIWEQALHESKNLHMTNMDLASFPSVWNPSNPNAPARALVAGLNANDSQADAWAALGFDFVRFASAMQLESGWNPGLVDARLGVAKRMRYAIAPLDWVNGKATQEMFVLNPTPQGIVESEIPVFQKRLDDVRAKHDRRISRARAENKK
jgi:hypothetical protein